MPRHVDVRSMRAVIDLRSLIGVPLGPLGRAGDDGERPGDVDAAARRGGKPDRPAARGAARGRARGGALHDRLRRRARGRERRGIAARLRRLRPHRVIDRRGRDADGRRRLRPQRRPGARRRRSTPSDFLRGARAVRRLRSRSRRSDRWRRSRRKRPTPARPAGRPLYGWTAAHDPLDRGRRIVLDRCESCGLSVTRAAPRPTSTPSWTRCSSASDCGRTLLVAPNRRSLQGGLGGAQWAGLEPELRRLHLTPRVDRAAAGEARAGGRGRPHAVQPPRPAADDPDAGQRVHPARQLHPQRPRRGGSAPRARRAPAYYGSTGP